MVFLKAGRHLDFFGVEVTPILLFLITAFPVWGMSCCKVHERFNDLGVVTHKSQIVSGKT